MRDMTIRSGFDMHHRYFLISALDRVENLALWPGLSTWGWAHLIVSFHAFN